MEEVATMQHEKKDSITVKRNAKGETAFDIKIYYDSDDGDEEVMRRLKETYIKLMEAFT